MAIVTRKLRNGKPVYWVTFQHNGAPVWERIGGDKRAAERRDAQQKAERKAGTYKPGRPSDAIRVGEWFEKRFFPRRNNRAASGEIQMTTDHALSRDWFRMMRVVDVDGVHIERVVEEMKSDGKIGASSITNVFSILRTGFKRAVFEKLRHDNPCDNLDKGTVPGKGSGKKRTPYERGEARAVMALPETPDWVRVFNVEAFYTGQREGEILGRRWKDWQRQATPLSVLRVHTQYDDEPLKGDDKDKVRPRYVPVHPELFAVLDYWWREGFELQHRRKPTLDDFIIPANGGGCLGRSAAYGAFRRRLAQAGVANRSLHSTRHTFITVARAGTLRHDLVERITHNAKGKTLDNYTHAEWEQLCEVVMGVDYSLDRITTAGFFSAPAQGLEPGTGAGKPRENAENTDHWVPGNAPRNQRELTSSADNLDASQDPDAFAFGVALGEHQGAHPPARAARKPIIVAASAEPTPGLLTVVEFKGERKTVAEWARSLGIPKRTLAARLVNGWPTERALSTGLQTNKSFGTSKGKVDRREVARAERRIAKTKSATDAARKRTRGGR